MDFSGNKRVIKEITMAFLLLDKNIFANLLSKKDCFYLDLKNDEIEKHFKRVLGIILDCVFENNPDTLIDILEKDFPSEDIDNKKIKQSLMVIDNDIFEENSYTIKVIREWFAVLNFDMKIETNTYLNFYNDFDIDEENPKQKSIQFDTSIYNLVGKIEVDSTSVYDINKVLSKEDWPNDFVASFVKIFCSNLDKQEINSFVFDFHNYLQNNKITKDNEERLSLVVKILMEDHRVEEYFKLCSYKTVIIESPVFGERTDGTLYNKNVIFLPSKQ